MFREILNDFNFGDCYVDGQRPSQINQLFMSIQSFNAADFTSLTTEDFYDYIVVDEFHHAAAK
jgi:superfamily II DNA or RNA helicase